MNCEHCQEPIPEERLKLYASRGVKYCSTGCGQAEGELRKRKRYRAERDRQREIAREKRLAAIERPCLRCGELVPVERLRNNARYCSDECQAKREHRRREDQKKYLRSLVPKVCVACGGDLPKPKEGAGRWRKFCDTCRGARARAAAAERYVSIRKTTRTNRRVISVRPGIVRTLQGAELCTAAVGVANAYRVAYELGIRGHEPFLPIAYNGTYDLIYLTDGKDPKTVEVRSARENGRASWHSRGKPDVYATVSPEGEVKFWEQEPPPAAETEGTTD